MEVEFIKKVFKTSFWTQAAVLLIIAGCASSYDRNGSAGYDWTYQNIETAEDDVEDSGTYQDAAKINAQCAVLTEQMHIFRIKSEYEMYCANNQNFVYKFSELFCRPLRLSVRT
jgi:hypothetical protein